ncbi:hypothetical protein [Pseudomonas syringae]|uniref:hypothetical protein n=1 Tax=Pseudomonas syringae TaxID=317 RepID=UPI00067BA379|nr:hypothetical protein [Pseudomonas syringae]
MSDLKIAVNDQTRLTINQQRVLDELRKIGRESLYRYREQSPYLFSEDCKKVSAGDEYCVFGMGGLSWWVSARLDLKTPSVLGIFKALESKGLVLRETRNPKYKRPLYWWPVGLAAELATEVSQ